MSPSTTNIISFIGGGIVVGAIEYFILKKRLQAKINAAVDDQVQSVKESLEKIYKKKEETKKEPVILTGPIEIKPIETEGGPDPNARLSENDQERFQDVTEPILDTKPKQEPVNGYPSLGDVSAPPFLINDKDFGDQDETVSWILWADGIVTTNDHLASTVDNDYIKEVLPPRWKEMFGDNETIYIRNNMEAIDIEIIKENKKYTDWLQEQYQE